MLTLVILSGLMISLSVFDLCYFSMVGVMILMGLSFMVMTFDGFSYLNTIFLLDGMSSLLSILSVWITLLMILAVAKAGSKNGSFFFFCTSFMMGMLLLCFFTLNLIGFYLFFEAVLIPIVVMIFMWGGQPERVQAGMYMLLYTLFGSLPLLIVLLMSSNSMSMSFMYLTYESYVLSIKGVYCVLLLFAFLVKFPMYGVHLWLPKAHLEAPVVGSMMLAGVLLKLGGYGAYRVYNLFMYTSFFLDFVFLALSLVGGFFVGLLCLRQVDIKSLIAYSSVCHMSLAIGGLLSGNLWGGWGCLILMLGHGLCSSALFCLANMMYERYFTRSLLLMKGLGLFFPSMILFWFIFSVINMGAPPSMNLLGEIFLMGSILKWSVMSLMILAVLSLVSASYSLYLFSYTQHGKSWFLYSVEMLSVREYMLGLTHFFPLILFILKIEDFMNWV